MVMRLPAINLGRSLIHTPWRIQSDTTFSTQMGSPSGGEPGTTTLDLDLGSGYVHALCLTILLTLIASILPIPNRWKFYRVEQQTVSTFLVLLTTGLQYMVQRLNHARDLERIERIRQDAKTTAWGDRLVHPESQKKVSVI